MPSISRLQVSLPFYLIMHGSQLVMQILFCRSQSQSCDLAQCLAQLTFSEKCFRKLYENMASYQDKLGNETVFGIFISILTKCKKFAKPEFKVRIYILNFDTCMAITLYWHIYRQLLRN